MSASLTYPPCPYCLSPTEKRDSAIIYGKSYGDVQICTAYPKCDAFVGCHKASGEPKGTLANAELREWRKRAHAAFDWRWMSGKMKRSSAYAWLSKATGIAPDLCHIGMMGISECQKVVATNTPQPAVKGSER